jgi:hypothetical protein
MKKILVLKLPLELLVFYNRCDLNIKNRKNLFIPLGVLFFFLLFLVVVSLPPQPLCTSLIKGGRAGRKGLSPSQCLLLDNLHIALQSRVGDTCG